LKKKNLGTEVVRNLQKPPQKFTKGSIKLGKNEPKPDSKFHQVTQNPN
jgi:hypothetical protein